MQATRTRPLPLGVPVLAQAPLTATASAQDALGYADALALAASRALGDGIAGVVLHGSLTLGDYLAGRSDIDLLVVIDDPLTPIQVASLAEAVGQERPPAPVRVDLRVVTRAAAAAPTPLPPMEAHLTIKGRKPIVNVDGVEDVACRVIAAHQRPDHATIARFIERHECALGDLFGEVLSLCADAGLAAVGVVLSDLLCEVGVTDAAPVVIVRGECLMPELGDARLRDERRSAPRVREMPVGAPGVAWKAVATAPPLLLDGRKARARAQPFPPSRRGRSLMSSARSLRPWQLGRRFGGRLA